MVYPDFTFLSRKTEKRYTGNMTGEWMIRYTREAQSEKYRRMKKTAYIPERI